MAAWTGKESAIYIRGVVQLVQYQLENLLNVALPKDGLYSKRTHDAFKAALYAKGLAANAAALDDQGPMALASVLFPDAISDEGARWFAVAWGWWAWKRVRPVPSRATQEIADGNSMLASEGDEILRPEDAEEFVGDKPEHWAPSKLLPVAAALLGVAVAGVVGWKLGQAKCPTGSSSPVLRGRW